MSSCNPPPHYTGCTCVSSRACSKGGYGNDSDTGVKCSEFCNICDTNGGGVSHGITRNIGDGGADMGCTQSTHIKIRCSTPSPAPERRVSPPRQTINVSPPRQIINVSPPRQIICPPVPKISCSCSQASRTKSSSKTNCTCSQTVQRGRRRSRNIYRSTKTIRFETPVRREPSPDRRECSISPIRTIRQGSCSPQPAHCSCSRTAICVSPAYCLTNRCRSCSVSPVRQTQNSNCSSVHQTQVSVSPIRQAQINSSPVRQTQVSVTPVCQTQIVCSPVRRISVSPVRKTKNKTRKTSIYIHSPVPSPEPCPPRHATGLIYRPDQTCGSPVSQTKTRRTSIYIHSPSPERCPPRYSTGLIMPVSQSSAYPACQTNEQTSISQQELTSSLIQHLVPETDAHICSSSSCPIQCTATIRRRSVSPVCQTRSSVTRCSSVSPVRNVRFSRQISISPSPIASTRSSSRRRHKSSQNKVRYSCLAGKSICTGKMYCNSCGFRNTRHIRLKKEDRSISVPRIIGSDTITAVSRSPVQLNAYKYSGSGGLACSTGSYGATFGYGTDVADGCEKSYTAKKICCGTCSAGGCTVCTGIAGTRSRCSSGTSYISQRTESSTESECEF